MFNKICILIPSLNPDEKLIKTIEGLKEVGFKNFIIVDDGSDEAHQKNFPASDQENNFIVLRHSFNKGKGAAIKTAFKFILKYSTSLEGVITVDGDGQHDPEDVKNCAEALLREGDKIILGCRDFSLPQVPPRSRFGNRTTSFIFKALCGIKISDTQTGLRGFPVQHLPFLLNVKGERFEYETNMLLKFKQAGIELSEVTIKTIYEEEGKHESHFKTVRDSIRVYSFILGFWLSSTASAIIDLLLFYLLNKLCGGIFGGLSVLISTVIARAVSSFANFTINRSQVFDFDGNGKKALLRYYALAIPQMLVSAGIVSLLSFVFSANPEIKTVLKLAVDIVLFFISYRIQQTWVFSTATKKEKSNTEKSPKKKLTVKNVINRSLLSVGTALLLVIVTAFSAGMVVAHGPSKTMRDMLVLSAMQASATKWVPGLFLPKQTVKEIVDNSHKISTDSIDVDDIITGDEDEWKDAKKGTKLIFLQKPNFKAYLLMVKDPTRVKVGVSSENFASATGGMRIFKFAEKYNALAVINAGEFADGGGQGTGAQPIGLTYSLGKKVWGGNGSRTFMGFTKDNKFVCFEGITTKKAEELGIRDAVCFQTGNLLIDHTEKDGKIDKVNLHYGDGNLGAAQRTAIGQRADGSVLMLVTDGRSASSIGATRNDVIDILVEYGAVSAGMLDGGSSAMMFYRDYYNVYNVDTTKLDSYQKQGLVNQYKAFTTPRRLPTCFFVTEE
ncbi:MAG: phosphodiester glycosidase family protein [Clostridia bacterium]|nr:phosphodiester glycosidase family protein [Clostridia bacterium]